MKRNDLYYDTVKGLKKSLLRLDPELRQERANETLSKLYEVRIYDNSHVRYIRTQNLYEE